MKNLILLTLVLFTFGAVQAQTQTQTQPKTGHYKAAEEMLLAMNMKQNLQESIDQMLAVQIKNNPSMQPAEATLKEFFGKYMTWDALKEDYINIYMNEFTEKELKDMTKFFSTPSGKKMASKQSVISMKGMQLGQEKVQAHMGELQEMLQKVDK